MCFSRAGARTAERRGPGKAGAERQVVLAPSHCLFRKQRGKKRKEKKNGSQSRVEGRRAGAGSPATPGWAGGGGEGDQSRRGRRGRRSGRGGSERDGGQGSEAHKASRRRGAVATCAPSAPAGVALSSSSIWLSCATAAMGGDLDVSLWTIGEKSTPRLRVPSSTPRVPCSSSPPRSEALSERDASGACCNA